MKENQKTVSEWCTKTFPGTRTKHQRVLALIEETTELAIAAGVSLYDILHVINLTIEKSDPNDSHLPTEAADVQLCLYDLASVVEFDLAEEVDHKMFINRSRPQSYYDMKQAKKKAMGIR